jgi:hypothetical protein
LFEAYIEINMMKNSSKIGKGQVIYNNESVKDKISEAKMKSGRSKPIETEGDEKIDMNDAFMEFSHEEDDGRGGGDQSLGNLLSKNQ